MALTNRQLFDAARLLLGAERSGLCLEQVALLTVMCEFAGKQIEFQTFFKVLGYTVVNITDERFWRDKLNALCTRGLATGHERGKLLPKSYTVTPAGRDLLQKAMATGCPPIIVAPTTVILSPDLAVLPA